MHELSVVKGIINTVLQSLPEDFSGKVSIIHLTIGQMLDYEEEWLERYLKDLAAGTCLEGASLKITKKPVRFRCRSCQRIYPASKGFKQACPECGSEEFKIETGREFYIDSVECQD